MSEQETWTIPVNSRTRIGAVVLALLTIIGALTTGRAVSSWALDRMTDAGIFGAIVDPLSAIPISAMPGTPRNQPVEYLLTTDNSAFMTPRNSDEEERWADIAGNYYTRDFVSSFSYEFEGETPPPDGPWVRVGIIPAGETLGGRIEARGLKPNFAYQIKLQGDYEEDRNSFGVIGAMGRWRGPGKETNFTDQDFMQAAEKGLWEAYIFFDWFVTDEHGNAAHEFALDQSLHVLWSAKRQRGDKLPEDQFHYITFDASHPQIYSRPKQQPITEILWAERVRTRYDSADQPSIQLPAWAYKANLVLTEESFHSKSRDGGWWATVYSVPIQFAIGPNASQLIRTTPAPREAADHQNQPDQDQTTPPPDDAPPQAQATDEAEPDLGETGNNP